MRVTINPVYVRCGQSARDDINDVIHTQLLYIIDRIIIIIIIIVIIIIVIIKNNNRVRSHWSFFYLLRILASASCCLSVERPYTLKRPKSDGLFSLELCFQGRRLWIERWQLWAVARRNATFCWNCRRFRGGAWARKGSSLLAGNTGANAELSFADAKATRRSWSHSNRRSGVLDGVRCLEDRVCRQSVETWLG